MENAPVTGGKNSLEIKGDNYFIVRQESVRNSPPMIKLYVFNEAGKGNPLGCVSATFDLVEGKEKVLFGLFPRMNGNSLSSNPDGGGKLSTYTKIVAALSRVPGARAPINCGTIDEDVREFDLFSPLASKTRTYKIGDDWEGAPEQLEKASLITPKIKAVLDEFSALAKNNEFKAAGPEAQKVMLQRVVAPLAALTTGAPVAGV